MTSIRFLPALIASLSLIACDSILEPEGAPPPPPDLPPPPPLDDDWTPSGDAEPETPEATPTPAGTQAPETQPATILTLDLLNARLCKASSTEATPTLAQANANTTTEPVDAPIDAIDGVATVAVVGPSTALAATLAEYPGIAKLEPKRVLEDDSIASGHCGATRIAENWFVTAAHCVDENYDQTTLRVGHEVLSGPVIRDVNVDWALCHAAYDGQSGDYANDIALLHVDDDTAFSLNDITIAMRINRDTPLTPATKLTAQIAGWGMTAPGGALSDQLLGTSVQLRSVGPAVIRVGAVNGAGPCIGDSGGPLFLADDNGKKVLTGVLSGVETTASSQACTGDYAARYTNIQGFESWMSTLMLACEATPGLCSEPEDGA